MAGLPTDSTHLSAVAKAEMIEDYAGEVDSQFAAKSFMRELVPVRTIRGTGTYIKRRVGDTSLKKVTPGVRPDAGVVNFGRVSVTVDTIILARENQDLLNEFQTDFNVRAELGANHGKAIGKAYDEAHIIMAIKGAGMAAPTAAGGESYNGAFGAGKSETLTAVGDEEDPDKLASAIEDIIADMQEEDIDTEELVVLVRPKTYKVLKNHDKLLDMDFSRGNGDYAQGKVSTIDGARIISTARIPTAVLGSDHLLSNADNGNAYNLTAEEANAVAVIMHPKSLLAGETIPLTSNVHYSETELQWFIDSYIAFGVAVDRPDCCGRVLKVTV